MKLFNSVGPNPQVVRMFAAELGIELALQEVDLMAGENRQAEYSAKKAEKNCSGETDLARWPDGQRPGFHRR